MVEVAAKLLVIAWLPGAAWFRLRAAAADGREPLQVEERLFWQVLLSLAVSLTFTLVLAAAGQYSFSRILAADIGLSVILGSLGLQRPRTRGPRPGLSAAVAVVLVAVGLWRFFPPAEYVMAGKDPGTYMNEGILLAQRGTLVYHDPLVTAVPAPVRPLFFATHEEAGHWGTRFMGFPILDLESGAVVGQFPHLFPASIALAYGVQGLTGARRAVGVWAILGLLAVYLAGARLLGRVPATAAAALLGVHVIEMWFGRYPNAEVVMQALVFGALLANARAHVDGDRFFAPVAAALLILLLFLRFDAVLAIAAVVGANLLGFLRGRPLYASFFILLAAGATAAVLYLAGPMRAYAYYPTQFILNLQLWQKMLLVAAAAGALLIVALARTRPGVSRAVTRVVPLATSVILCGLAAYALFFRTPAGRLALENAYALRMYAAFYVTVPAVLAALVGYALLARSGFWRDPAMLLTFGVFAVFFFYKIRIHPEHFWAARRFLPVILPGTLLLASAAAAWGLHQKGWRRWPSGVIGGVFLVLLGTQYLRAAEPVAHHVEYAGMIPELERLAARIADDDLLLVESRDAGSDAHVFALPLAYIYARHVLVLGSARPDHIQFAAFLEWARTRYRSVYFLGSGGTDLLSRSWSARPLASSRFQVPEYESAPNAYPRSVRRKEFDFGLYELLPADGAAPAGFDLDVGLRDDLHVVRFHAKEEAGGQTVRWSGRQSFVSIPMLPPASREVVIVMSSGGRPDAAPPAEVSVHLGQHPLGTVRVKDGFHPYRFPIPAEAAAAAARSGALVRLRLVTTVWNPHQVLGSPDDRELGVMVDRVQIK